MTLFGTDSIEVKHHEISIESYYASGTYESRIYSDGEGIWVEVDVELDDDEIETVYTQRHVGEHAIQLAINEIIMRITLMHYES